MKTIAEKKKEAKKLQRELFAKLAKVQKLCIKRVLDGGEVLLSINHHVKGASLSYVGDLDLIHPYYFIYFIPWNHCTFDFGDSICEFFEHQHDKIDYWIELLSK